MSVIKKITARPPALTREELEMEFISDGSIDVPFCKAANVEDDLPWNKQNVREDVIKIFNVRISEPSFLKLQYISRNILKKSTNAICVSLIEELIAKELESVTAG